MTCDYAKDTLVSIFDSQGHMTRSARQRSRRARILSKVDVANLAYLSTTDTFISVTQPGAPSHILMTSVSCNPVYLGTS